MMDALGTKGITERMDPTDYYNRWESVITFIENNIKSAKLGDFCDIYSFSDTLIVVFNMNNNQIINPFFELGQIISHIIRECYRIEILLRGSLSFGTFYKSHKFVIGPAVDDAAVCYDKADIIGIVASPSFHSVLENVVTQSGKSVFPFIKTPITSKGKYYKMWTLNWNSEKDGIIISSLKMASFNMHGQLYFQNIKITLKLFV